MEFLRRVVNSRSFAQADLDTALIERERAVLFDQPPLPLEVAAAGVAAHALAGEAALQDADPWSRRDGWRLHGGARAALSTSSCAATPTTRWRWRALHDGALQLRDRRRGAGRSRLRALGGDRHDVHARRAPLTAARSTPTASSVTVFAPEGRGDRARVDLLAHAGEGAADGGRLTAPMPGKVVAFLVKAGDRVEQGQALAVMEAMKMEHTIAAPRDGTVRRAALRAGRPGGRRRRAAAAAD